MERYRYVTSASSFLVIDRQRRSDAPIAVCRDRSDAEKIVEALNQTGRFDPDRGVDGPREWNACS